MCVSRRRHARCVPNVFLVPISDWGSSDLCCSKRTSSKRCDPNCSSASGNSSVSFRIKFEVLVVPFFQRLHCVYFKYNTSRSLHLPNMELSLGQRPAYSKEQERSNWLARILSPHHISLFESSVFLTLRPQHFELYSYFTGPWMMKYFPLPRSVYAGLGQQNWHRGPATSTSRCSWNRTAYSPCSMLRCALSFIWCMIRTNCYRLGEMSSSSHLSDLFNLGG